MILIILLISFAYRNILCLNVIEGALIYRLNEADNSTVMCPSNTFSIDGSAPSQNISLCTDCPIGYSSPDGSSNCNCSDGSFIYSDAECMLCDAGFYSNTTNSTTCYPCQAGSYSGEGSTLCSTCSSGYYAETNGSSSCSYCAENFYTVNSTSCIECSNSFKNFGASSVCFCPPGYYINNNTCDGCETGSYSPSYNANECITCPEGTDSFDSSPFCSNTTLITDGNPPKLFSKYFSDPTKNEIYFESFILNACHNKLVKDSVLHYGGYNSSIRIYDKQTSSSWKYHTLLYSDYNCKGNTTLYCRTITHETPEGCTAKSYGQIKMDGGGEDSSYLWKFFSDSFCQGEIASGCDDGEDDPVELPALNHQDNPSNDYYVNIETNFSEVLYKSLLTRLNYYLLQDNFISHTLIHIFIIIFSFFYSIYF